MVSTLHERIHFNEPTVSTCIVPRTALRDFYYCITTSTTLIRDSRAGAWSTERPSNLPAWITWLVSSELTIKTPGCLVDSTFRTPTICCLSELTLLLIFFYYILYCISYLAKVAVAYYPQNMKSSSFAHTDYISHSKPGLEITKVTTAKLCDILSPH